MSIFFSSDHHFWHENIIQMDNRPFNNLEHMHEEMINRWNSVVKDTDQVYYLGDFSFEKLEKTKSILYSLNGTIYFIQGNHDKYFKDLNESSKIIKLPPLWDFKINGTRYILCHYPMREWRGSHGGSIHLHGHSHGKLPMYGYSMDIGVDCNNFYPISIEQVNKEMETRKAIGTYSGIE